jgi:hypothetical protein
MQASPDLLAAELALSDAPSPLPPQQLPSQPQPQSYGRSVLASLGTLRPSALASAPATLAASPCLRPALQWAGTVAALLAAHRAVQGGSLRRCANDAILGGVATAGAQWYTCRNAEHDLRLTTRAYYAEQARGQGGGGGEGGEGGASPSSSPEGAWRGKVDRLVPK